MGRWGNATPLRTPTEEPAMSETLMPVTDAGGVPAAAGRRFSGKTPGPVVASHMFPCRAAQRRQVPR